MKRKYYPCHYCRQGCTYVAFHYNGRKGGPGRLKKEVWKCTPCKVVYRFDDNISPPTCLEFWAQIKEDYYLLTVFEESALLQVMREYDDDGEDNAYHHIIKLLNERPQGITPQNVRDKIQTYLLLI